MRLIRYLGVFLCLSALAQPGDELFKQRSDPDKAREALRIYRATAPNSWPHSMACQFVGFLLTEDREEKKELFQEGVEAGRKSLESDPDCVPCHFWTGINLALYGDTVGPFRTLASLKEVREHLLTVERLDPAYASAGALRVLGLIEWKLPGVLGGSNARAKRYLTTAIELLPGEPLNYLFLIKIFRDTGDEASASNLIKKAAEIPAPSADQPESLEAWKELLLLSSR